MDVVSKVFALTDPPKSKNKNRVICVANNLFVFMCATIFVLVQRHCYRLVGKLASLYSQALSVRLACSSARKEHRAKRVTDQANMTLSYEF